MTLSAEPVSTSGTESPEGKEGSPCGTARGVQRGPRLAWTGGSGLGLLLTPSQPVTLKNLRQPYTRGSGTEADVKAADV